MLIISSVCHCKSFSAHLLELLGHARKFWLQPSNVCAHDLLLVIRLMSLFARISGPKYLMRITGMSRRADFPSGARHLAWLKGLRSSRDGGGPVL